MNSFPPGIKFKYQWRKYQRHVLDELSSHLDDKHLHVVAPPGSGKTILGLEVVLRLNKPTLILAPTIAIRNQWIQRFCELFLQVEHVPEWISRDIRNPKFLTVITYQGLHAACNDLRAVETETEEEEEEKSEENGKKNNTYLDQIVNGLKAQSVNTIVVDEAHHMKSEWWKTLTLVKEAMQPVIIGLTATPPYDVSLNEWQNYTELNGPVDAEISVPELVIEGDLCPHQDYVHLTYPSENELEIIEQFRTLSKQVYNEIVDDDQLLKTIESLAFILDPETHQEWLYNNIHYFSACLIFLNHHGKEVPLAYLGYIDEKLLKLPKLDEQWLSALLEFYIYKDKTYSEENSLHKKAIENKLRRYGVIENKSINFLSNKHIANCLNISISKLQSISDIVKFEHLQLKEKLRLVVLTDYIRKDYLVMSKENNLALKELGVLPIFEKLRREHGASLKLGVLTGSIILLPLSAIDQMESIAFKRGIGKLAYQVLPYDERYVLLQLNEQLRHDVVSIVTDMFQEGAFEVLVGTKSLLGEGWDAPAINTLILASFVGSFVQSNQMRGRAIRAQNGNKEKTGNIWHLVCIDPTSQHGGQDMELLSRRFKSFVGLTHQKFGNGIENGLHRLNLPELMDNKQKVYVANKETFKLAADRQNLKSQWDAALVKGQKLTEEIAVPVESEKPLQAITSLYLNKSIAALFALLLWLIGMYLEMFAGFIIRIFPRLLNQNQLDNWVIALSGLGIVTFGGVLIKYLDLYFNYRDIGKDIQRIGETLLQALVEAEIIATPINKMQVVTTKLNDGKLCCHLLGGSTFEKSAYIQALNEIVSPINNPRYIIVRKSRFLKYIKQTDYHAVPDVLGQNKKMAEYFKTQWEQRVGACELIFTRNFEGRQLLLKSRLESLSAKLSDKTEIVNKWH